MQFFQKFLDSSKYRDIRKQMLKSLQVRKYEKGEEVFHHNSVSDK
jgi:hypothetical protein